MSTSPARNPKFTECYILGATKTISKLACDSTSATKNSMVENNKIMIKVNGKEITLTQIAAIIAILTSLTIGVWNVHEYFAKSSEVTSLIKRDWVIQTSLLDIKINTNTILLKQLEKKVPTDPDFLPVWQQSLDLLKEKIANDNAEKAAICDAQIAARKPLEVVPCENAPNIPGLNQ